MSGAPRQVVVIGASLAGLSTARALRSHGFDGALTVVGDELQLAGNRSLADHPDAVDEALEGGSLQDCSFTAVYRRAGEPVAVLALDQPRVFAGIRRRLVTPTLSRPSVCTEGEPA